MPRSIYREWIEALGNVNWGGIPNVQLNSGHWHWFVLVRFKNGSPSDVLVKVVGVVENNDIDYNKLIQPDLSQAPGENSSDFVFDPFGAAILRQHGNEYKSVLLEKLGLLPQNQEQNLQDQKFVQTYSWKIEEKRWNLVGSLPLVPPMEVGGICWDGKYLEDFRLSAVRFPIVLTNVLAVTMRLGVVAKWQNAGGRTLLSFSLGNDRWNLKRNGTVEVSTNGGEVPEGRFLMGFQKVSNRNRTGYSLVQDMSEIEDEGIALIYVVLSTR